MAVEAQVGLFVPVFPWVRVGWDIGVNLVETFVCPGWRWLIEPAILELFWEEGCAVG